jgi:hypothetical protein
MSALTSRAIVAAPWPRSALREWCSPAVGGQAPGGGHDRAEDIAGGLLPLHASRFPDDQPGPGVRHHDRSARVWDAGVDAVQQGRR